MLVVITIAILALFGVACSGTNAAPTTATAPVGYSSRSSSTDAGSNPAAAFKTLTVEGGSVSVAVTPIDLKQGAPADFEIAMNTHSVDLSADMLKVVVVRDDAGKEYAPTKWDGPAAGGHHRSGTIEFPALAGNVKSVTLIVKGIAGVPERDYRWDVPQ
jgi:hypothetical protein